MRAYEGLSVTINGHGVPDSKMNPCQILLLLIVSWNGTIVIGHNYFLWYRTGVFTCTLILRSREENGITWEEARTKCATADGADLATEEEWKTHPDAKHIFSWVWIMEFGYDHPVKVAWNEHKMNGRPEDRYRHFACSRRYALSCGNFWTGCVNAAATIFSVVVDYVGTFAGEPFRRSIDNTHVVSSNGTFEELPSKYETVHRVKNVKNDTELMPIYLKSIPRWFIEKARKENFNISDDDILQWFTGPPKRAVVAYALAHLFGKCNLYLKEILYRSYKVSMLGYDDDNCVYLRRQMNEFLCKSENKCHMRAMAMEMRQRLR